jgi:signal transduction histidine kinase/ActR/RegA family two-component response regulator
VNVLEGLSTASGDRRWVTVNTRPLVRPGETDLFAVVTSFTDVTEQRRMQAKLAQAGKMEALGRLAGGVAHDFNNILTAITGYTSLLLADLPVDSELRVDLQEVEQAAERAANLVDQLLSFSRQRVLEPAVADVQETITAMHTMLQRILPADIEIQMRFRTTDSRAAIDRGQLEQVVLNLAVNAGDAMPDGGRLVLETDHVDEQDGSGPFVVLSVSDTGIGMDASIRTRIFEPFFTTKEIGKGTGLGLSTVYGIVTQAGGRVTVYSEPRDGSTFRIFLPSTQGEPLSQTGNPRVEGHQTGDETILVVEDDEAVRALAVETLRRRGFHVIEAGDADVARRAAREHQGRIDLLLCDVVLPTTRGPALAAEILRNRSGIRVLFMSGYAEGIVSPSIVEGAGFLAKPFRPDELVQRVREVLDRRSSHG